MGHKDWDMTEQLTFPTLVKSIKLQSGSGHRSVIEDTDVYEVIKHWFGLKLYRF